MAPSVGIFPESPFLLTASNRHAEWRAHRRRVGNEKSVWQKRGFAAADHIGTFSGCCGGANRKIRELLPPRLPRHPLEPLAESIIQGKLLILLVGAQEVQPTSDFSDLPAQTDLIALIAGKWLFPFVANAIIQLGVPRTRTELRLPRRARWPGSESVGVNGRVHRHRRRLAAPALHRALPAPPYPPSLASSCGTAALLAVVRYGLWRSGSL